MSDTTIRFKASEVHELLNAEVKRRHPELTGLITEIASIVNDDGFVAIDVYVDGPLPGGPSSVTVVSGGAVMVGGGGGGDSGRSDVEIARKSGYAEGFRRALELITKTVREQGYAEPAYIEAIYDQHWQG